MMKTSSSLKSTKNGKTSELKRYRRRKEQLEKISGRFGSDFVDYVDDINTNGSNINTSLSSGVRGQVDCSISLSWENAYGDSDMAESQKYVSTELIRVEQKISQLESEINTLNIDIAAAEEAEKAAKEASGSKN